MWLVMWSMAGESEAEGKQMSTSRERGLAVEAGASDTRTTSAASLSIPSWRRHTHAVTPAAEGERNGAS